MKRMIRVGSRDSSLAVIQARIVIDTIRKTESSIEFDHVKIKTAGDKDSKEMIKAAGGKGVFVKELEQALSDDRIDIAVHSYKDMPYKESETLPVVALSKRETPFDVLVLPEGFNVPDKTKPVGSSSLRRSIQFSRLFDGFEIKPVRGNILTRLSKLDNGEYSALILACAGLNRLSLQKRISRIFTLDEMIPAASQGILAVQGRSSEDYSYLETFHSRESEIVSRAERRFLKTLNIDCLSPAAVYGELHNNEIQLTGIYADIHGNIETGKISGDAYRSEQLGETLAVRLKIKLEER